MKRCNRCEETLPLDHFNKRKVSPDGLAYVCKVCNSTYCLKWSDENRDRKRELDRKWRLKNSERVNEWKKEWVSKNRQRKRQTNYMWYLANKEKAHASKQQTRKKYPERYREIARKENAKRRLDVKNRIRSSVSGRIRMMLKGKKDKSMSQILKYTMDELRVHLESLFQDGMTWENYGHGPGKWVIDHKIPVASFTFSSYTCEGFQKCWELENLQPLWFVDNCRKGARTGNVQV